MRNKEDVQIREDNRGRFFNLGTKEKESSPGRCMLHSGLSPKARAERFIEDLRITMPEICERPSPAFFHHFYKTIHGILQLVSQKTAIGTMEVISEESRASFQKKFYESFERAAQSVLMDSLVVLPEELQPTMKYIVRMQSPSKSNLEVIGNSNEKRESLEHSIGGC